ncbi:MAG TPA: hypothetical protein VGQ13_10120 [Nitrososphaera sp.]|nr:hypothetical protein [Nitrososphaera sp.]
MSTTVFANRKIDHILFDEWKFQLRFGELGAAFDRTNLSTSRAKLRCGEGHAAESSPSSSRFQG